MASRPGGPVLTGFLHGLGVNDQTGPWYAFWSGIGSIIERLLELAVIAVILLRHHNCQVKRCWRLGRHDYFEPGTGVKRSLCWRHHPDVTRRQLTRERLHLYAGQRPGKG